MDITKAAHLARNLMDIHGLHAWKFEFDNAKRRFGVCRYRTKTIGLSYPLTKVNIEAEVKDTILHEIAHALTPGHHHDDVWKAKCREIGCRDSRCYTTEYVIPVQAKYQAVCGGCGRIHSRHKKTIRSRRYSCKCQSGISWDKKVLLEYK